MLFTFSCFPPNYKLNNNCSQYQKLQNKNHTPKKSMNKETTQETTEIKVDENFGEQQLIEVDPIPEMFGIVPTLQNVVATVNLGIKGLDLKRIALKCRNASYNQKRFAAVIMRIRDPKTTALIFSSGKMVCTGAKSENESRLASRKYCRILQKLGYENATHTDFKIQNIVGSCDVGFPVWLEQLANDHHQFCSYEPELFPGLIYRMLEPKIVLLIFVSGKIVLTGAKVQADINTAFNKIYPTLMGYRQQPDQIQEQKKHHRNPKGKSVEATDFSFLDDN